ncbi:MAG: PAS domain-containing protein [bacterium]|nr:PAS domain-containing protein [bacterium]
MFGIEELFFSTTDGKGIIRSGNEVFVRLSKYPIEALLGTPHNVIRHPDMPRAVFRLLWDYLLAGRMIAAYVKNLAADGSFWWVLAVVTPLPDGFLSIRLKPTSKIFGIIKDLYPRLREFELESVDRGKPPATNMQRALDELHVALRSLGLESYDEFMHMALREEMRCRDAALARWSPLAEAVRREASAGAGDDARGTLIAGLHRMEHARRHVDAIYTHADEIQSLHRTLGDKASFVERVSRSFRLAAMNTAIKAAGFQGTGEGLGVIAAHLGTSADAVGRRAESFNGRTRETTKSLMRNTFHLATIRLSVEMSESFCREAITSISSAGPSGALSESGGDRQSIHAILADLHAAQTGLIDVVGTSLEALVSDLEVLRRDSDGLRETILMLRFAQLAGVIESARLDAEATVGPLLHEVGANVARAQDEFRELDFGIERLSTTLKRSSELLEELLEDLAEDAPSAAMEAKA